MSDERSELFGTDGIRGAFGRPPLDEATVRALAAALAVELSEKRAEPNVARDARQRNTVVLGGDTRDSTPTLCRWLTEELCARGARTIYLGTVPTPCVAFTTRTTGAACGIVVSASHNPHPDNGIKLIDTGGFKWSPEAELRLERRMRSDDRPSRRTHADETPSRGTRASETLVAAYLDRLAASLPGERPLDSLAVALDTGNGAASPYARELFERLGARVRLIHAEPDGRNINDDCGSTRPGAVADLVKGGGCDLGFAFDGDADRVILVDEQGTVRDGDAILYLWARDLQARGQLPGDRIVATSMSNLGLEVALRRLGIQVERCDVGDRVVVETMRRHGIELGGEQSGHIVNLSLGTTGDGLLTALQIAGIRQRDGRPAAEMLRDFERFPQLLKNLRVSSKPDLTGLPRVVEASREVQSTLGDAGRLVLRYSGTEPLVRIMIEGQDREQIEALADDLAAVLTEELN